MASDPEITLRPTTSADADAYAAWGQDREFCAAAEWTPGRSVESLRHVHRRQVQSPPVGMCRLSALHEGQVVGYVDLHGTGLDERELGYVIGPSSRWGRGLGTAVARAGLRHGFTEMRLRRITAEALDANTASVRILQRVGMVEIGRGEPGDYLGRPSHFRRFRAIRPE